METMYHVADTLLNIVTTCNATKQINQTFVLDFDILILEIWVKVTVDMAKARFQKLLLWCMYP